SLCEGCPQRTRVALATTLLFRWDMRSWQLSQGSPYASAKGFRWTVAELRQGRPRQIEQMTPSRLRPHPSPGVYLDSFVFGSAEPPVAMGDGVRCGRSRKAAGNWRRASRILQARYLCDVRDMANAELPNRGCQGSDRCRFIQCDDYLD